MKQIKVLFFIFFSSSVEKLEIILALRQPSLLYNPDKLKELKQIFFSQFYQFKPPYSSKLSNFIFAVPLFAMLSDSYALVCLARSSSERRIARGQSECVCLSRYSFFLRRVVVVFIVFHFLCGGKSREGGPKG